MEQRYIKLISYWKELSKPEKELKVRKEFQSLKEIISKMKFFLNFNFQNEKNQILLEANKDFK